MDEADQLIGHVKACLDGVHEALRSGFGRRDWTSYVKRDLATAGFREPYTCYTCASGVKTATSGEFLYDVCWLKYDEKEYLMEATLIAEIEWGRRGEIDDDFQKLLLGRARLKLMAFGGQLEDNETIVKCLAKHLQRRDGHSLDPSEVYLLAGYEGEKGGFSYFRMDGRGTWIRL